MDNLPVAEFLAQAEAIFEVVAREVVVAEGVVLASRPLVAAFLADLVGVHFLGVEQDPLALTRHPALWQRAVHLKVSVLECYQNLQFVFESELRNIDCFRATPYFRFRSD